MNSTKANAEQDELLREFFQQRLVPLADRLSARGVRFFPLGPEPDDPDWWVHMPSDEPELVELDATDFATALRGLWEEQGLGELAEHAEAFVALSRELEIDIEQTSDVSPEIYVMH
jgi:hypothetical protein